MDWRGLLPNILGSGIWWLIVILAGAAAAFLKAKGAPWIDTILYGLVASGLVAIILVAMAIRSNLLRQQQQEQITPDNVAEHARVWIDNFQLTSKKINDAEFFFVYQVTTENGRTILFGRPKKRDRYLFFQANIAADADTQTKLAALSKDDNARIERRVALELARLHIGWTSLTSPITTFRLRKLVPITESFTEATFIEALDEMESDIVVALASIQDGYDSVTIKPTTSGK